MRSDAPLTTHDEQSRLTVYDMSDERLRQLQRQWLETGLLEDHATYLRELVRVGGLEPARLELAAYCSHRAASEALDRRSHLDATRMRPFDWAVGLQAYGNRVPLRAAVLAILQLTGEEIARTETHARFVHELTQLIGHADDLSGLSFPSGFDAYPGGHWLRSALANSDASISAYNAAMALAECARIAPESIDSVRSLLATWALDH